MIIKINHQLNIAYRIFSDERVGNQCGRTTELSAETLTEFIRSCNSPFNIVNKIFCINVFKINAALRVRLLKAFNHRHSDAVVLRRLSDERRLTESWAKRSCYNN